MKNLAEFKALILRYRGITLEEIQQAEIKCEPDGQPMIRILTGAGDPDTCSLCKSAACSECVWTVGNGCGEVACAHNNNSDTYDELFTDDPLYLLAAVRARADHMEAHLTKLGITL